MPPLPPPPRLPPFADAAAAAACAELSGSAVHWPPLWVYPALHRQLSTPSNSAPRPRACLHSLSTWMIAGPELALAPALLPEPGGGRYLAGGFSQTPPGHVSSSAPPTAPPPLVPLPKNWLNQALFLPPAAPPGGVLEAAAPLALLGCPVPEACIDDAACCGRPSAAAAAFAPIISSSSGTHCSESSGPKPSSQTQAASSESYCEWGPCFCWQR